MIENNGGRPFCQQLTERGARDQSRGDPDRRILESGSRQRPAGAAARSGLRRRIGRRPARRAARSSQAARRGRIGGAGSVRGRQYPGGARHYFGWLAAGAMSGESGPDLCAAFGCRAGRDAGGPADRRSWYARSRSRAATALLFAAPGIPALFMGQEFLEDKNWSDNRQARWPDLVGRADRRESGDARFPALHHRPDRAPAFATGVARQWRPRLARQQFRPGDRVAPLDRNRRRRPDRDRQPRRATQARLRDRAAVRRRLARVAQQRRLRQLSQSRAGRQ